MHLPNLNHTSPNRFPVIYEQKLFSVLLKMSKPSFIHYHQLSFGDKVEEALSPISLNNLKRPFHLMCYINLCCLLFYVLLIHAQKWVICLKFIYLPYTSVFGSQIYIKWTKFEPNRFGCFEQIGCDRQTDRQATEFSVLCLYKSQGTRINNE